MTAAKAPTVEDARYGLEAVARLCAMRDENTKWDLSPNDRAAIASVLRQLGDARSICEALREAGDEMEAALDPGDWEGCSLCAGLDDHEDTCIIAQWRALAAKARVST